ncbi:hypothetical protein V9T40_009698 [Parthenolecanium corni]|uniref:Uncharacterized protein n=1 Tax=Parthenolecanium corni TaxID=536013 RepID=A0AAN9TP00_9HEMI
MIFARFGSRSFGCPTTLSSSSSYPNDGGSSSLWSVWQRVHNPERRNSVERAVRSEVGFVVVVSANSSVFPCSEDARVRVCVFIVYVCVSLCAYRALARLLSACVQEESVSSRAPSSKLQSAFGSS